MRFGERSWAPSAAHSTEVDQLSILAAMDHPTLKKTSEKGSHAIDRLRDLVRLLARFAARRPWPLVEEREDEKRRKE